MNTLIPFRYRGVWQRTVIERPTGTKEKIFFHVFWIQTQNFFTDIRIPKRFPFASDKFSGIPIGDILKQRACAGKTLISENPGGEFSCILRWNGEIDYHPDCGSPDIGGCYFLNLEQAISEVTRSEELGDLRKPPNEIASYYELYPTMIEKGLPPNDYLEVWVKRDDGSKQSILQLNSTHRKGIWLLSGHYWCCTLDRFIGQNSYGDRIRSNQSDSLGMLLDQWNLTDDEQFQIATEFESYFGRLVENEDKTISLIVDHSTIPDKEGKTFIQIPSTRLNATGKTTITVNSNEWSIIQLEHEELLQIPSPQ